MAEKNNCTEVMPQNPEQGCSGAGSKPDKSCGCRQLRCGCIGYGYVPVQEFCKMYDLDKSIMNGTVFPELDLNINEYGCVCKMWGGVSDE